MALQSTLPCSDPACTIQHIKGSLRGREGKGKKQNDWMGSWEVSKKVSGGCYYTLPTRFRTGNALQKFVKYIKT